MSFEGYVEIGQDGMGIIEADDNARGIFTANVQTCYVAVFVCKKATILLHDSGQIKLTKILTLIKKYGTVRKVVFIVRPAYDGRHDERFEEIAKVAGASGNQLVRETASTGTFAVLCAADGRYQVINNVVPVGVALLPERDKRQAVCEVNNFFLEPKARTLRLDVQYHAGKHGSVIGVDKSLAELLKTVKAQAKYFFPNVAVLGEAHKQGLLELPEYLLGLHERLNLGRFRSVELTHSDALDQAREHALYVRSLA
ncbi:hypothetical protein PMO31116_00506 [Pandoraea morbifera]|uniref:Uncharacterized protein n=1 Tax=Pandoraea morbifera TaxID=2508300 RepID=A0A5E4S3F7_9BURK|nr:hypothetical protein [Pandoraea morbifera]VVD69114.1 hypothetical protein PMO31116_00506 [Pandoraea morbifera]